MNYAQGILLGAFLTLLLSGFAYLRTQRLEAELTVARDCYERGQQARAVVKLLSPYTVCAPTDELTAQRIKGLTLPGKIVWFSGTTEVLRRDAQGRWWAGGRELRTDAEIGAVLRRLGDSIVQMKYQS